MKPADYILIEPLPEAEIKSAWEGTARKLQQRKRNRQWGRRLAAGAAAMAVAASLVLVFRAHPEGLGTGAVVEARSESVTVRLSDGSEAQVEPLSQLNVLAASPNLVRVALPSGSATFDVSHRPERQFSVVAGDIEVQVRGTRFTVRVEPKGTSKSRDAEVHSEVSVERGVVDVVDRQSGERIARLTAGARWSGGGLLLREGSPKPAALVEAPAKAPPIAEIPKGAPVRDLRAEAKLLFNKATDVRRQGNTAEAIELYGELVRRYPNDEYSRVAALELGRLRLREGGQPQAAAKALEQAVKADPQSPLQPDALAQLVAAYEQSGNQAQCRKTKARYLREFPNGPHAAEVRRRCP
ncbi:MAG: FecR domain-containing protein [Polyangiaceae bacterium]|nr:FecR domain-containing protein [Polyangiaceae bacterium]